MKLIILDRDGTINIDKGYIHKPEDLEFIPGSLEGIKLLQDQGYNIIIATNQSGINRQYYTEFQYQKFTNHFKTKLKEKKITIDNIFHCPHTTEESCYCRKPKTGMVKDFILENQPQTGYVIGDKTSDIKLGENLGFKTILVQTGEKGLDKKFNITPNYIANNLLEATKIITQNDRIH